jgi:hypothetical protein
LIALTLAAALAASPAAGPSLADAYAAAPSAPAPPAWTEALDAAWRLHHTGLRMGWQGGIVAGVGIAAVIVGVATWSAPVGVTGLVIAGVGGTIALIGGPVALMGAERAHDVVGRVTGWTLPRDMLTAGWVSVVLLWPASYAFAGSAWAQSMQALDDAGRLDRGAALPPALPPLGLAVGARF